MDDEGSWIRGPLDGLDPLLQHRLRLALLVLASRYDRLSFSRLKQITGETDGSLGAQLRRLEDAAYLTVDKEFVGRKPTSWYAITREGRAALAAHLEALEEIVRGADVE